MLTVNPNSIRILKLKEAKAVGKLKGTISDT
jgi:hypothetical protein